jgi:hypothetical protein
MSAARGEAQWVVGVGSAGGDKEGSRAAARLVRWWRTDEASSRLWRDGLDG